MSTKSSLLVAGVTSAAISISVSGIVAFYARTAITTCTDETKKLVSLMKSQEVVSKGLTNDVTALKKQNTMNGTTISSMREEISQLRTLIESQHITIGKLCAVVLEFLPEEQLDRHFLERLDQGGRGYQNSRGAYGPDPNYGQSTHNFDHRQQNTRSYYPPQQEYRAPPQDYHTSRPMYPPPTQYGNPYAAPHHDDYQYRGPDERSGHMEMNTSQVASLMRAGDFKHLPA